MCRFASLYFWGSGCWNCMTKITFLMHSFIYVSKSVSVCSDVWKSQMKFSTKQKRTNLYMKWCHKIRFVPHSHNFHIRYCCWAISRTNFTNNVTVWILYLFLYMWTLHSSEWASCKCLFNVQQRLAIPQVDIFANWPMVFSLSFVEWI